MDVQDDLSERSKPNSDRSLAQSKATPTRADTSELTPGPCLAPSSNFRAVDLEGTIPLPGDMLRQRNVQLLKVAGDSMIGDHLLDGDLVIVEKRNTAKDGDLVLACTMNEGTAAKRFFRDGPRIRLEPSNPSYEALLLDENDVIIQGVVVGILRKYRD